MKQTVLQLTQDNDVGEKQGKVPNISASEATKLSPLQAQLVKYKDEAIPWSFETFTHDSGGGNVVLQILVHTIPC